PRLRARIVALGVTSLFAFYAFTTALRALEWSDPLRLVMAEASKRPLSPDAQFARADMMLRRLRRADGTPPTDDAIHALDSARKLPGAGILFEQLLITTQAKRHMPINPAWWVDLVEKLKSRPANASDARSLALLNSCFLEHICEENISALKDAYAAAMSHGNPRATLLSVHAEFAWHLLGDKLQGERDIRAAVDAAPSDVNARRNLFVALLATNQLSAAKAELTVLKSKNWFGLYDSMILSLESALSAQEGRTEPSLDQASPESSNRGSDLSPHESVASDGVTIGSS
ncbi:hypothetical protein, partial [Dokdonella immobilis]